MDLMWARLDACLIADRGRASDGEKASPTNARLAL
jgi:hypothetical protein